MKRPEPTEYFEFYAGYISKVDGRNIIREMQEQLLELQELVSLIPEEKENYAYAEGKWTVKEVIGHIIDTERIMAYRALRISRKDKTKITGFDENFYVSNSNFRSRSLYDLAHEFSLVREGNVAMIKGFSEEMLNQIGVANDKDISVRALIFIMIGHVAHHLDVIRERYLNT
ncbi:MAG: DinB family protein [Bacteroidia bacterium]